ncbi:zinc-dependent alcohol dehydrogenase family protein [Streptomyces sp. VRA16 Mangrove soil]|uniref:zinc-dependent alcohol dehydrogenase family protein n=1 Tax=Streptomyces sp. VRA16 Mangrove soil TaxID=2817434 RepID=UPI001A9E342D|nr:zinc-dependent alcohol dehydrogenase family protein [Streptomyces sp. VRA16 Mangrove soil]MBO1336408.1 zinc-dependent alcohol dehydrogenase family protein [Streptomyces sp. VRA16 Mangrove soil]
MTNTDVTTDAITDVTTTRAVLFDELGGPEVLRVHDVPLRRPGPGELLVKVQALGLNRAEALFRAGAYYYQPTLPGSRLGYEASGVVEAVAPDVTDFAPGDPVMTGPGIEMGTQGVYGDRVVLPATAVVARSRTVDAITGAAAWLTYSTAYGGLVETAGMRPGDHVLITGASSGVGTAALQVARRVGAVPVATTRTEAKKQALLDLGAEHVIVTDTEDVAKETHRVTGGTGADILFDAIGGPRLPDHAAALRSRGTIVVYGWLDGPIAFPMNWPQTIHTYANFLLPPDGRRRFDAFLATGLRDGALRPHIAEVFEGLDRVQDAHRLMESNTHTGKIVVRIAE